jgi:hypothetical protein
MHIKKSCGELRELDLVGFVNELGLNLLLLPCNGCGRCAKSYQLDKLGEISLQHFGKKLDKLGINL